MDAKCLPVRRSPHIGSTRVFFRLESPQIDLRSGSNVDLWQLASSSLVALRIGANMWWRVKKTRLPDMYWV